jgi:chemotaxis protein histidine kinase CheA
MNNLSSQLKSFERRVRFVRAWRGLAMGACFGAGLSTVWATLDWRSVVYTEWLWMGILTVCSAAVGAIVAGLLRVSTDQLAQSVDRRAHLEDRLATAQERSGELTAFDAALAADAHEKLATIQPNRLYPIRLGRWHAAALSLAVAASAIFILGNTPIVLTEQGRKDREDLKKQGQTVQRVVKENFETPDAKAEMSDAEKKLADQLRRFDRDLEKAHMSKEEALQKSNELSQKAEDLMKSAAKGSEQSLAQAETARQQLEKASLEKAGLDNVTPQMAEMPDGLRDAQMNEAKKEGERIQNSLEALKRQLAEIQKKLENKNLSAKERKALEEQKKALENKINSLSSDKKKNADLQKALELSKAAQEVFRKLMSDPLYKQVLELQKKLIQNSKAGQPGSESPPLTEAEREAIKKKLEELAAKLKDEKAMKAYLQALIDALKRAKEMGRCRGAGLGLGMGLPGLGGSSLQQAPAGPGAPSEDIWMGESGHIHRLDKPEASRGTTTTDVIHGEQQQGTGPQAYVEIRAPSTVGNRTSVPYKDVLPSYEKKAESAMNRQQIPKEHQKRVKDYFDSLAGNKKN